MLSVVSPNSRLWLRLSGILCLVSTISLWGCQGSDDLPTAKASGTVIVDGEPVSGGELLLVPVGAGKNAAGAVDPDGTFTLTTYLKDDGAIIGTHTVTYIPENLFDSDRAPGDDTPTPPSIYAGMVPEEAEVTITEGENVIEIVLVKKK